MQPFNVLPFKYQGKFIYETCLPIIIRYLETDNPGWNELLISILVYVHIWLGKELSKYKLNFTQCDNNQAHIYALLLSDIAFSQTQPHAPVNVKKVNINCVILL